MANTSGLFGGPPKHEKQWKTEDDSSKRLLKDLMQKYLNKFKTLYVKAFKKNILKVSGDFPVSSPSLVFSLKEKQAGGIGVFKQFGKSRSTSSASSSPISRRDDSLLLQHDGIQSAILHCKKSLNSSRDSSLLSSNSSYEKLMDSARISCKEGNVFQHLNY